MTRRVNVAVMGSVYPGRANLAVTLVPGSPFSFDDTWSMRQPRVLAVSTWMILSPSMMPASSAGVCGYTFEMTMLPSCSSMSMPTPP